MMKKFISMIVALTIAALANSAHAEFVWKHPGADPYATSKEEAMKTRESAFHKLGFPTQVVALLMKATEKPGSEVKLAMGDKLSTMLSKGGVLHKDVVIAWEAPIRGTELVAPVEKWQVTWEGKVFTALRFEVCQNWSGVVAIIPTSASPSAIPTRQPAEVLQQIVGEIAVCPAKYTLGVYVWERKAIDLPGVQKTHALESEMYNTSEFVGPDHVSRYGPKFREAQSRGELSLSSTSRPFRLSLIMTERAHVKGGNPAITKELVLGDVVITGFKELSFMSKQIVDWDAIRLVAINGNVLSPPVYRVTEVHEMRLFNHLPGISDGEWAGTKCRQRENWIE